MKIKNIKQELTEKEWELIQAIRNYQNSKHNPSQQLEYYILKLFEALMYENDKD